MIDCKNNEWNEKYKIYLKFLITSVHVTLCFENKLITNLLLYIPQFRPVDRTWSCEKWSITKIHGGEEYRTNNKKLEDSLNWSHLV